MSTSWIDDRIGKQQKTLSHSRSNSTHLVSLYVIVSVCVVYGCDTAYERCEFSSKSCSTYKTHTRPMFYSYIIYRRFQLRFLHQVNFQQDYPIKTICQQNEKQVNENEKAYYLAISAKQIKTIHCIVVVVVVDWSSIFKSFWMTLILVTPLSI